MAHPLATRLSAAFISNFWSADRELTWTAVEVEHSMWLDPNTLLLGRVDAEGIDGAGHHFFGEWKSLSSYKAKDMDRVKAEWRMKPQSLTYGVLIPEAERFTVRWAIKPDKRKPDAPIRTDFEWYSYTHPEIDHWRSQLLSIANDIRHRRATKPNGPWNTNYHNCLKYGPQYPCPLLESCHALDFNRPVGPARVYHLDTEAPMRENHGGSNLVVLDATRASLWFECEEEYRRLWEGDGLQEESEALLVGNEFHDIIHQHISQFITPSTTARTK